MNDDQIGERGYPEFLAPAGRAFVEWLRARESRLVDAAVLAGCAKACPSDPWHELLRQAVEEHTLETGGGEMPVDHFIEWLAEWGRDIRRRQRGLLLLTMNHDVVEMFLQVLLQLFLVLDPRSSSLSCTEAR